MQTIAEIQKAFSRIDKTNSELLLSFAKRIAENTTREWAAEA